MLFRKKLNQMNLKLSFLVIVCGVITAFAQQEPQYSQYMYNMNMVNPAYMINEPSLIQVGALYRTQWVGLSGAPDSGNVFANIPLNDRIELSANFLHDKIGDPNSITNSLLNLDTSYKINLTKALNLSFGVKLGVNMFNTKFNLATSNADPTMQNRSSSAFNFGTGAFLFGDHFYAGISSPNLVPNKFSEDSGAYYESAQHIYLIGGYVFEATDKIKLKPSAVVKQVIGAPLSFDVSANAMYNNKFEFGLSYRFQDAIAALAAFNIGSGFKIGYSYDYTLSKIQDFNSGSHEFVLLYKFDLLGLNKTYSSPRFY